ncbi:hypothetical protein X798_04160 [Onchocerca flexuosa]|uniref:Uncharacterized protein n=1 Tax=Onchocerca flexuosa TaxID=387005 RepID=A0A238BV18_9BILA|nr:hypothetical protein X798_04160 [Onchocerca flexuosa]
MFHSSISDEKCTRQTDEAMKYSGRWLLGIVFLVVALGFIFFLLFNIHRQVSTERSDLLVDYFYDQYTDQKDSEDDTFDTQQITDAFQESSTNVEQLTSSQIKITSQSEEVNENSAKLSHYTDYTKKSIEDDMIQAVQQTEIKLDDEIFSKFLHPLINSKISKITPLEEKFNLNLANFPNATKIDALLTSKLIATDSVLSHGRSAYSKMPIIREFSTSNNLATSDPVLIKNNIESDTNQIAMKSTKFIKNLQNLRKATVSMSNLTTVSPHLQQENIVTIDKETETEVEDKEIEEKEDNEYEDFLDTNSAATTSISTTTTISSTSNTIPGDLLKLKNCLVIYTDSRGAEFVRQTRDAYNTQIFEMSMHDLPLYRYRGEMEGIIRREQKGDWRFSPKTRYHPEANSADYNIIVNSKPYFLYNATQSTRFRASDRMFVWIDAGYGHGRKGIIPDHCHWRPQLRRDRITIIQLTPIHDKLSRYSINDLYRVDWVVLSGGFIAGDSYSINRFYRFYQKSFMELLDSGRIDDDQTILTLMLKHYATLFNPLPSNGDWYAIFRLFPCNDRQKLPDITSSFYELIGLEIKNERMQEMEHSADHLNEGYLRIVFFARGWKQTTCFHNRRIALFCEVVKSPDISIHGCNRERKNKTEETEKT